MKDLKIKLMGKVVTITEGDRRDFFILMAACTLNISFAFEKFFIVIGHQLSDLIWLFVYGGLGLFVAYIATIDFIKDEIEEEEDELHKQKHRTRDII